ncbi:unnamed protein product [Umbelopsis sp. WA50703]
MSSLLNVDDQIPSDTSIEQRRTEKAVLQKYTEYAESHSNLNELRLEREAHAEYLARGLNYLSRWMVALDASKPWLTYWILHALDLLEVEISQDIIERGISSITTWQHPKGGFSGGPDQLAHLAPTYAAINSLAIFGTQEAFDVIDRKNLYEFLMRMKQPDGSFTMHEGGEIDIRGLYCALSVAALTNLLTPELTANCNDFIKRAQTYEGGIGPYPGKEAHNGYTYCGIAAMQILGTVDELDVDALLTWCAGRQMNLEGGFQGRTNKLVDGCYSFWGAGDFPIISAALERRAKLKGSKDTASIDYLFDRDALQRYVLICCQDEQGGLADKPGVGPDYYHTCYCLSGLSIAQHHVHVDSSAAAKVTEAGFDTSKGGIGSLMWAAAPDCTVLGDPDNLVAATHPVHNITIARARTMIHHFYAKELQSIQHLLPKEAEIPLEDD